MAENEEVTQIESKATPEQQAAAEKMGWIPPARFKGNVEGFVDADEYIKRGETVLPIVKEQNKRLHAELDTLKQAQAKTEAALTKANKLLEDIEERHSVETQKAVETARKELKKSLAAASEAGDHEAVAELTDQMVQLNKDAAPAKKEEPKPDLPPPFKPPEDLVEWAKEHKWFGSDRRKTALALGIAQELRESGDTTTGRIFYDKVVVELNKTLGGTEERTGDKVETGRSGGGDEPRSGGKKGYHHLPAEAKAACDADARKFVGPDKKYKDAATWRAKYAEIYFGMES